MNVEDNNTGWTTSGQGDVGQDSRQCESRGHIPFSFHLLCHHDSHEQVGLRKELVQHYTRSGVEMSARTFQHVVHCGNSDKMYM